MAPLQFDGTTLFMIHLLIGFGFGFKSIRIDFDGVRFGFGFKSISLDFDGAGFGTLLRHRFIRIFGN